MENIHKNILHLEPEHGLLNDPNGLAFFNGKYYVFHQWNRFKLDHSYKEWGLFTSSDLLHWKNEETALMPDSKYDKNGVYSGNAVVKDDSLHLFYTGNTKNGGIRKSYQRQAISQLPNSFIKKDKVIETPADFTEHFRDPYVTKTSDGWQMIVGAQTKEYQGALATFYSADLSKWQYKGIFYTDSILDQMCECPSLVNFGDKQLLIVCPQKRQINPDQDISSYAGYLIGMQKDNKFYPETEIKHLDAGIDFYAPQVFEDNNGRKIMLAWMSRMSEEQEERCPTNRFGYVHCLTLPRELIFENGYLYQRPLKEYRDAFTLKKQIKDKKTEFIASQDFNVYRFKPEQDTSFEISLANETLKLKYDSKQLIFFRKNWINDEYEVRKLNIDHIAQLELYCDHSAIEIFINDGEQVMSARYFADSKKRENHFSSSSNFNLEIGNINL